jgi:hypothetical protein
MLLAQRSQFEPDGFFQYFAHADIPPEILTQVYDYFQGWMRTFGASAFPVLPDDSIEQIYRLDVEEVLHDLCKLSGRELLDTGFQSGVIEVKTVSDLVRFLSTYTSTQGEESEKES